MGFFKKVFGGIGKAFKSVGKFLYISGQISLDSNGKLIKGKVGKDIDLKKGQEYSKIVINIQHIKEIFVFQQFFDFFYIS